LKVLISRLITKRETTKENINLKTLSGRRIITLEPKKPPIREPNDTKDA
jgi:hypothetical protein